MNKTYSETTTEASPAASIAGEDSPRASTPAPELETDTGWDEVLALMPFVTHTGNPTEDTAAYLKQMAGVYKTETWGEVWMPFPQEPNPLYRYKYSSTPHPKFEAGLFKTEESPDTNFTAFFMELFKHIATFDDTTGLSEEQVWRLLAESLSTTWMRHIDIADLAALVENMVRTRYPLSNRVADHRLFLAKGQTNYFVRYELCRGVYRTYSEGFFELFFAVYTAFQTTSNVYHTSNIFNSILVPNTGYLI